MEIIGILILIITGALLCLRLVDTFIHPIKWTCKWFGWHNGIGSTPTFEEEDVLDVNLTSTCSKCGKSVIQDSQGNWF